MRKIAIVGTAPSSVTEAPYDDNSWEIWSLGANYVNIRRFTRWFELHTTHALTLADALPPKRIEFLQKIGKDLVIGHKDEIWPNATLYPLDDIVKCFGNYFTSSIAWMLGLAIYEGADEIGLWGVDMVGDCEYSYQRACCEYLLGIARGKGIMVTISPNSPLLRAERMYAFEYTNFAGEVQKRISEARHSLKSAEENYLKALEGRSFAQGALSQLHDFERRWG